MLNKRYKTHEILKKCKNNQKNHHNSKRYRLLQSSFLNSIQLPYTHQMEAFIIYLAANQIFVQDVIRHFRVQQDRLVLQEFPPALQTPQTIEAFGLDMNIDYQATLFSILCHNFMELARVGEVRRMLFYAG